MANIRLKELLEANVDPKLVARSKETGKLVYFKSPENKAAAMKAGTHEDPKAKKGGQPKADVKPNDMFGGDYSKDRGGDTKIQAFKSADGSDVGPNKYTTAISKIRPSDSSMKIKSDDTEYWKDDEYSNTQGYIDSDDEDYDEEGSDVRLTSDRLSKVETALEDDLDLRGNGFETTRESSGGGGGWEGPMTIVSKDADYNDEDNFISLSVGSPNNDGKFSIVFANQNGEPYFEPNYDALTGDNDLEPQQAYKVTKALMKMPEVQKLLKGEMSRDEFKPIYDKLKSKFSKTESTKLTSMIKK
jgi:hypothetical protein